MRVRFDEHLILTISFHIIFICFSHSKWSLKIQKYILIVLILFSRIKIQTLELFVV